MIYNIYLIRHAKTKGNKERRYAGLDNQEVSGEGLLELRAKVQSGYYPRVGSVYISPMLRCRQTAYFIYPELNLEVVKGFAEYNFGEFEGKSYEELKDNPVYRQWIESGGKEKAPGGEDIDAFKERCCQAFVEIVEEIRRLKSADTALVIHGGTIMSILERYLPGGKSFYDWQIPNAAGYKLTLSNGLWQTDKIIKECQLLR